MKGWIKFEEKMNKTIERLGVKFRAFIQLITPKKLSTLTKRIENWKIKKKEDLKVKAKALPGKFKNLTGSMTTKLQSSKEKISKITKKVQSYDFKKVNTKVVVTGFIGALATFGLKLKKWYIALRPETILTYTIGATVISLTSINIYKSSKNVIEKEQEEEAILVEKVETPNAPSRRPAYYKGERKQLSIQEVNIPVLIEGSTTIKSLIIDMDIISSNRYIREYLYENEHLIKDKLNQTLRPIIPEFPLTDEGKDIIREKVIKEINQLLHELKIEGEIKQVLFTHVIAA